MKKLFIIMMIAALLTMGNAMAVTELHPSTSNACTFDSSALADYNEGDLIIHISYASDEEYLEVFFGMHVDFSDDLAVFITDPDGNEHQAEIISRDWTNLEVWVDGLEDAKTHTLTISGVAAKDAATYPEYADYGTYTVSFITVPSCCV